MRILLLTLLLTMGPSVYATDLPTAPPTPPPTKDEATATVSPPGSDQVAPATTTEKAIKEAPKTPAVNEDKDEDNSASTTTTATVAPKTVAPKIDPNNAKEKILSSISKMTPKEVAELMNFVTAMEEDVSNTPVSEDALQTVPTSVRETLKRIVKADPNKISIVNAPIHGLYEATIESEVIYVSADGHYVIMGDIRDANTGRNLTEDKRDGIRKEAMAAVKESDMVVFAPATEVKGTLNVFTDVDCGYCAKFHLEAVKKLNEAGIKVRYLAFPRAGKNSETYHKMVSVWCAKDRQIAMTDAKAGRAVTPATCDNPIAQQYDLGKQIGVTGTPALVLSSGELIPGFVPPERLIPYILGKSTSVFGRIGSARP